MRKTGSITKTIAYGFMIAGVIILLVGAFYLVVKAGIPYQDPTVEMQIQYAINMGIGDELFKVGLIVLAIGIAWRVGAWLIGKGQKRS